MQIMILAIIPARGGSKRVINKNIKKFFGKPIIGYPIEQAIKSKIFHKIIVTTDSKKIANVSKRFGADVPFIRPKYLSGDKIMPIRVIEHSINWCESNIAKVDFVCVIYPTTPMINYKDLRKSFKKIKKGIFNYVFSAKKFYYPVQRSFYSRNGSTKMLFKKNYNKRSQDLEKVYHDAGQFYWGKKKAWLDKKNIFGNKSSIHLINYLDSHDVDTNEDWNILKKLYKLKNENDQLR